MSNVILRRAGTAVLALVAAAVLTTSAAMAQQDPDKVRSGQNIWRSKANCQTCHGWSGDGVKMDTQMPDGANLRETTLERDGILEVMRCGRPGLGMPAFERNPYSDGRCYGMKMADIKAAELNLTDPAATLTAREMDDVIEFLYAKVIGKGTMDRQKCIEFWGTEAAVCKEYK